MPELNLALFTSALTDPVEEDSVWTIPAADILSKAVLTILAKHKPHAAVPNVQWYTGEYYNNWTVWVGADTTLQASLGGGTLNLTALEVASDCTGGGDASATVRAEGSGGGALVPGVFVAHPTDPADLALGCRWLDDGTDQELVYFEGAGGAGGGGGGGAVAAAITFMGDRWERNDGATPL